MYIQIGHQANIHLPLFDSFKDLIDDLNDLLGEGSYVIENNGKILDPFGEHDLLEEETYKIWPRILGGKGGFGSLLRSFGKQILISKNKEACRDLNGRRIRDVNNEKKLKEWMQKQLEKSSSTSNDKRAKPSSTNDEKADYRSVPPPHKFSDSGYDEQKKQIATDIDEAVQIAADLIKSEKSRKKKSTTAISTNDDVKEDSDADCDADNNNDNDSTAKSKKRRHSNDVLEEGEVKNKKTKKESGANGAFFIGIDVDDLSTDDDDDDEKGKNGNKKKNMKKK